MLEKLEMIPCPRCGTPFPKRRQELGYNYCVNCSTEKPKVCRIEDQGEGEDTVTVSTIITQEEAMAIAKAERGGRVDLIPDQEPVPDYSTFEEQDEIVSSERPDLFRDESKLTEMEREFAGLSERSLEEMERMAPMMDDEDEPEIPDDY